MATTSSALPEPGSVKTSTPNGGLSSEDELGLLIEQTLTHIRNKQITLQETEHTPRRMRKQLAQLRSGIQQVENFIARDDILLDAANKAEHHKDLEEITSFVKQIEQELDNPSDIAATINRLNVRNGYELLRRLLDEVQIEMRAIDNQAGLGDEISEIEQELELLKQSLKLQRQRLSRDILGTPLGNLYCQATQSPRWFAAPHGLSEPAPCSLLGMGRQIQFDCPAVTTARSSN